MGSKTGVHRDDEQRDAVDELRYSLVNAGAASTGETIPRKKMRSPRRELGRETLATEARGRQTPHMRYRWQLG